MALEMCLGETLVFDISFEYQGPVYTKAFVRASIGVRVPLVGFNEGLYNHKVISVGPNATWATYEFSLPIVLKETPVIAVADGFDLEVKVGGFPGPDLFWKMDNAVDIITAGEAEFRNLTVEIRKG